MSEKYGISTIQSNNHSRVSVKRNLSLDSVIDDLNTNTHALVFDCGVVYSGDSSAKILGFRNGTFEVVGTITNAKEVLPHCIEVTL
ncbi:hypothetical protein [Phocoenobacter skyensis]|uniref:Uncharacterized protein n=1 Tax=Phocoenobacter skyensis TaxID=97481 RepID=A0A1H8A3Y1_9PAST|nr:hypothetical protein [Pasteurella skyensis]MDP8184426.1 hypothetical protein [Pasteurella skyensis]QLB22573.1 hypothetical protein A6B44_04885 [Pasteurella skyensis]SEM64247.1 hypothetical protein SAMN05444853_1349 [Pasteurella skyensis]